MYFSKEKTLTILVIFCFFSLLQAETRFVNISTSIARPLGMGGTFGAIEDDLASVFYNPATFNTYRKEQDFSQKQGFIFVGNLIAPFVVGKDYKTFGRPKLGAEDGIRVLAFGVKSLIFSTTYVKGGFIFNEESFSAKEKSGKKELFNASHFDVTNKQTAFVNFFIAERVRLGITFSQVSTKTDKEIEKKDGLAFSYGVYFKPNNNYRLGIYLNSMSDSVDTVEERVLRLSDSSVNFSCAFTKIENLILAGEIKNLTSEGGNAAREFHFGAEYNLVTHLTLRSGFYKEIGENPNSLVWTFGLGILDQNQWKTHWGNFEHRNYALNYALVFEKNKIENNVWHVLSFLVRI
ncbi:hypothetical protein IT568_05230 [bacterium]|nr:hypothetical protein [bacterium]